MSSTKEQHYQKAIKAQKVIKIRIPAGAIICHKFTTQGLCPLKGECPRWHSFDLQHAHLQSNSSYAVSQDTRSSSKVAVASRSVKDIAARMSAWQTFPAKLAAEDKAATAKWEARSPVNPDDVVQPVYKETFIETSAENEGRRTGYRSTQILADVPTPSSSSPVSQNSASSSEITVSSRSWDPLPSEWATFGRENLTKEVYAVIIEPHLKDLDKGIVTYKFLHQRLPSPNTSSPGPTTFHPFPKCPYDIRLQIWKYVLDDQSNTVRVGFRYDFQELDNSKVRIINGRLVQLNGPPPLLLVCKELTRIAALSNMYRPWFRSEKHEKGMLFNPKTDRLFLNLNNTSEYKFALKSISYAKRMQIHKLAIPLKHLLQGDEDDIGETIAFAFKNLKQLYVLAGDGMKDEIHTRNEDQWHRIKKWHKSIWAVVNGKRKYAEGQPKQTTFPTIEKEFIPAHVAHHYRIDEYVLTGSVMRNLEYVF